MTNPLLRSLFDETERRPLSVTELTMQVRSTLESRFASVWVEGEISNFKAHTSGHWYFTIKDDGAQLRATCFRGANRAIRFRPTDGLQVRARGRVSVYEPRGDYQLIVEALDPVGAGALRIAFEQMRDRLAAEGLFDKSLKRPLPRFPRRIGVITSPTGAAIRDILHVVSRRTRTVHVLFSPTRVQGEGAALEIVRAIELLNEHHAQAMRDGREADAIDVIILGRGGGSAEDLWAFNDELLARAIRASRIPVISAVGHETDFTISDFAADMRAPTPSAAAEMVAAREDELATQVEALTRDLTLATRYRMMDLRTGLQGIAMSIVFGDVRERLRDAKETVRLAGRRIESLIAAGVQTTRRLTDGLAARLSPVRLGARVSAGRNMFDMLCAQRDAAGLARLEDAGSRFRLAAGALDALSPLAVLERGYALAQDESGRLIRDAAKVQIGDDLRLRLAKGALRCRVEEINNA
jgi:exodeoxyribonuclease VII large subunit